MAVNNVYVVVVLDWSLRREVSVEMDRETAIADACAVLKRERTRWVSESGSDPVRNVSVLVMKPTVNYPLRDKEGNGIPHDEVMHTIDVGWEHGYITREDAFLPENQRIIVRETLADH